MRATDAPFTTRAGKLSVLPSGAVKPTATITAAAKP